MNLGIFFKHRETGGGIYQYFLTLLQALNGAGREDRVYLFFRHVAPPLFGPRIQPVRLEPADLLPGGLSARPSDTHGVQWKGELVEFKSEPLTRELVSASARHGIDLMFYPSPEREAFETGIPYVMAVHDLAHRILPRFPEFTGNGILKQREYVYTEGIRNASYVLVDSEIGKEQVLAHYPTDPEKIVVLPFVPPFYIFEEPGKEQREEWGKMTQRLPERFLFYPAQLWPHKNHENLIRALQILKKHESTVVPVVFTGLSDPLCFLPVIKQLARELQVADQITCLGYLDQAYMRLLYETALALVMPTFLGPTNLPVLEAFATGCPVITSDIPGARESAGDAALLVDPESPDEIAASILRVWEDESLRESLKKRGKERIAKRTMEAFTSQLTTMIDTRRRSPSRAGISMSDSHEKDGIDED